jgi:hypothetical protein
MIAPDRRDAMPRSSPALRLAAASVLALAAQAAPARADRLCRIEAPAPVEVREFYGGDVIGALPPGMPVVVTDRTFVDQQGRDWVFAVSFEIVSGWVADRFVACR